MTEQELAQENKILEINTGSTLYGTRTPESDCDKIGVFIANWEHYVGLKTIKIVVNKLKMLKVRIYHHQKIVVSMN